MLKGTDITLRHKTVQQPSLEDLKSVLRVPSSSANKQEFHSTVNAAVVSRVTITPGEGGNHKTLGLLSS